MEKLLPIKFFEKRKIDEQLTEAGGSKDLPKWVMQGDNLTQHSQHLARSMTQVVARFEAHKKSEHELPMVMATTITEKALAKTHRSTVVDLLNSDSLLNVIGIESIVPKAQQEEEMDVTSSKTDEAPKEMRRLLSIVTTDELIANINRALQDTQNNARLISSIENVEPFEARSGAYNPENKVYRVRLLDYQDSHRNQLAQTLFRNQCSANGIAIDRETRYSPDMRIYRITLDSIADMETVRGFEGVFSIEESIPIRVDMDTFDDMSVPAIKQPKSGFFILLLAFLTAE